MSELLQKQFTFTRLLASLIDHAYKQGYTISLGEAWRTPEQAKWNAVHGIGISNSLHKFRLAIDLNLFKDDAELIKKEDYEPLGKYWQSLSTPGFTCIWGGDFNDSDHFSIEHNGIR